MNRIVESRVARSLFAVIASLPVLSLQARADSFLATYLAPGVQTPAGITSNYETFNSPPYPGSTLVTNFGGSSITGIYSGAYNIKGADVYGGAGGTGSYIYAAGSSSYTLSLSSQANYFGLWFSALDAANELQFYSGSNLLYTFTPAQYISLVGSCPTSAPQPNFCGNPNPTFLNGNSGQQYAYLNFYDETGDFDRIVFTETNSSGNFESDNQAVALLDPSAIPVGTPIGTPVSTTPEPTTWLLALSGLTGMPWLKRFRRSA